MLHLYTIKQPMHKLRGINVETTAIVELNNYIEDENKKVIIQAKEELIKLNNLKKIQELYQKKQDRSKLCYKCNKNFKHKK